MWLLLAVLLVNPTLSGRVTDRDGNALRGAVVRAVSVGTPSVEVRTDNRGRFRLEIFGPFQLEVRSDGFRSLVAAEARLPAEGVYQVDVVLLPGDPAQIDSVRLDVEDPEELIAYDEPGATEALPRADRLFGLRGGINVTGIAEGQGQQWVAASGSVFTSSSLPSTGDTAEFSAELGDAGPRAESLPSGQDAFHGSAYGFHRNDALNARNFFDPPDAPIPPFKYSFWGADAGGKADERTFFYAQYWGLRIRQSVTRAATVPDPRWLTGDFSGLSTPIVDPDTGLPFANNRIPAGRFSSSGLALARLYPLPTNDDAVQNYRAVGKISTTADSAGVRLDRRITVSDEASLEYQFDRDTTLDPFNLLSGITNLPFFGIRDALQSHSVRIAETHVFSGDKVAQFRFALNALKQPRTLLAPSAGAVEAGPAVLVTGVSNLGHAANTPQRRSNRGIEWTADLAWRKGGAATKFGGAIRHFPFQASLDLYTRGQFQFTNGIAGHPIANLLLGYPANALRMEGDTERRFKTSTVSAFIEHSRNLSPRLSASVGLRYDYQTPFRERDGRAANFNSTTGTMEVPGSSLYKADRNNFAPRVGLSAIGPLGTSIRAGYGLFYDTLAVGDSLFLLGLNPPFVRFAIRNNGDVLPQFDLDTAFSDPATATPPSIFSASRHLPNPYIQHWNVSIERRLGPDLDVAVSYFGERGTRLRRQVNLNQPSAGSAVSLDERRPFPAFRNIFQFENSASSITHAGEVRATRRFYSGLGFFAAYRFSKAIDDATLISMLPQDSHNLRGERGLSDFDVRHRLEFSGEWTIPGWQRLAVTQRWQLQVGGTLQSGMPLSAVLGTDISGTGSPIMNRPDLVGDPNQGPSTPSRFFNPETFRTPEPGRFGTSGRNVITGPGTQSIDVALVRAFRVTDIARLQFRLDAFNALNHPNFAAPPSLQNLADSPDFGALFIARSPRILQVGLKFLW